MNSANLEQYFGEKEIEFIPAIRKDYCFTMNMLPGCRFRSCGARLSESGDGAQLQLSVEMPLTVHPSEYAGLSVQLAELNRRVANHYGDRFSEIASGLREGFTLDVIGGAVRYELCIRRNPSGEFGAGQVRLMVEEIAGESILEYAEDIMRMISRESVTLEVEQRRAAASALRAEAEKNMPRSRSPFERFMEFIGVTPPAEVEEYDGE